MVSAAQKKFRVLVPTHPGFGESKGFDQIDTIEDMAFHYVEMFDALGLPPSHPERAIARKSVDKLLIIKDSEAYCQPCVSPVWDTALVCHTLLELGQTQATAAAIRGLEWLKPLQVLDVKGDWAGERPFTRPGGWACGGRFTAPGVPSTSCWPSR